MNHQELGSNHSDRSQEQAERIEMSGSKYSGELSSEPMESMVERDP